MRINNAERFTMVNEIKSGAHVFIGIIFVVLVILSLSIFFDKTGVLYNVNDMAQLEQGILVCSTALMGLSGIIIIEIKKAEIPLSNDVLTKVEALNLLGDLLRADLFLRWSLLLSLVAIISSCLQLMHSYPISMLISWISFVGQLIFFVWGLLFGRFLPEL